MTTNTFSFLSGVWMCGDVILAWDTDPFNQLTNLQTEDKFKPVNTGRILDPHIVDKLLCNLLHSKILQMSFTKGTDQPQINEPL